MNSIIYDQSIKTRFFATLFANIGGMGLSFLAGIIIARGLGPAGYGNFNFLLGSFASIILLLDIGTASAFYTFLSQRKRGKRFYLYYFLWIGIEFLVAFLLISFIHCNKYSFNNCTNFFQLFNNCNKCATSA